MYIATFYPLASVLGFRCPVLCLAGYQMLGTDETVVTVAKLKIEYRRYSYLFLTIYKKKTHPSKSKHQNHFKNTLPHQNKLTLSKPIKKIKRCSTDRQDGMTQFLQKNI